MGKSLLIVPILDRRNGVSISLWNLFAVSKGLEKSCYILLLFILDPCAENVLIFILSMNNVIPNFHENEVWFAQVHAYIVLLICFVTVFNIIKTSQLWSKYFPCTNHLSRPLTPTPPPEQPAIRPSYRLFTFDSLHFFSIIHRVTTISLRTFCSLLARPLIKCTTTIEWNGRVPFREEETIQRNWKQAYVCDSFTTLARIEGPLNWWHCLYGSPNSRQ